METIKSDSPEYQFVKEYYDKYFHITTDKKKAKWCTRIALQLQINTVRWNAGSLNILRKAEWQHKKMLEILRTF